MIARLALFLLISLTLSGCLPTAFQKGQKSQNEGEEFYKGEVVAGFPNLPRYPKATVIESVSYGEARGATFVSSDNIDTVLTFYNDYLPQLGWEFQLLNNGENMYEYKVKNSQYEGTILVNVAADGKSTAMTYSAWLR